MTYMSVERPTLQAAFALAHIAACDQNLDTATRTRFKKIAAKIWQACGEHKPLPATIPGLLAELQEAQ